MVNQPVFLIEFPNSAFQESWFRFLLLEIFELGVLRMPNLLDHANPGPDWQLQRNSTVIDVADHAARRDHAISEQA
jgi:hypothetical protein